MSEENKLNGYEIIQRALSSPDGIYELALKLVPGAVEIGRSRIGNKSNPECATEYTEAHVEIFIWALGLMCQEWVLENFSRKSEDGHCRTHKQTQQVPCKKGSEFHKNLYEECKRTFEDVLRNAHAPKL
jgi:hypothetical protein